MPEGRQDSAFTYIAAHTAEVMPGTDGGAPEWVHLLPAGTFRGRDGRGPHILDDAAGVIDRSRQLVAGGEFPIDYDHQTEATYGASRGHGRAPAAGWIVELQERDDGLWGRVEWTAAARKALADREYRFLSPVYAHAKDGTVLALLRAALTNTPNLDLMAVAARAHGGGFSTLLPPTQEDTMDRKALCAALGLSAEATDDAVLKAAQAAGTAHTALGTIAKALDQKTDTNPVKLAEAAKAAHSAQTALPRIAEYLGQTKDATPEVVMAAASHAGTVAKNSGQPDAAQYVPRGMYDDLAKRVAAMETAQATQTAAHAVDHAIQSGKLTPAQRDWAVSYASQDPKGFQTFVANQPAIMAEGALVPGVTPPDGADAMSLTPTEKAVCTAMGLSEDDFLKTKKAEVKPQ
jgi:phage I-like protein